VHLFLQNEEKLYESVSAGQIQRQPLAHAVTLIRMTAFLNAFPLPERATATLAITAQAIDCDVGDHMA
jgi:hypothetical protein